MDSRHRELQLYRSLAVCSKKGSLSGLRRRLARFLPSQKVTITLAEFLSPSLGGRHWAFWWEPAKTISCTGLWKSRMAISVWFLAGEGRSKCEFRRIERCTSTKESP